MSYPAWDTTLALLKHSEEGGLQENIIVNKGRHLDQCDAAPILSWEKQVLV